MADQKIYHIDLTQATFEQLGGGCVASMVPVKIDNDQVLWAVWGCDAFCLYDHKPFQTEYSDDPIYAESWSAAHDVDADYTIEEYGIGMDYRHGFGPYGYIARCLASYHQAFCFSHGLVAEF